MGTEEEQKKALAEYQKVSLKQNKEKRKRIRKFLFLFSFVYIGLAIIFKLSEMQIVLPIPVELNMKYYDVRLNERQFEVYNRMAYRKTILPFLVYIESGSGEMLRPRDYQSPYIHDTTFFLTVHSYTCYYPKMKKEKVISCHSVSNARVKENTNEKMKMTIYQYTNYNPNLNYEEFITVIKTDLTEEEEKEYQKFRYDTSYAVVYQGDFVEDITEFISKDGVYGIKLESKKGSLNTTLTFGLVHHGDSVFIQTKDEREKNVLWQ